MMRMVGRGKGPSSRSRVCHRFVVVVAVGLIAMTLGGTRAYASTTSIPLPSAPSGCFSGYFCSYNSGNGGGLCFQTTGTIDYPPGCADRNQGAYNNTGHDTAFLNYYNLYYSNDGAYYVLNPGHYLLYMNQNKFNACWNGTTTCPGYGQPMGDNVASVILISGCGPVSTANKAGPLC